MPMFAELSLMSFIYELVETFYFPSNTVKKIYPKYLIQKIYIYHLLADTDSICLKLIFINNIESEIPEKQLRDILFEIIVASKIYDRFDSSRGYWKKFNARKEHLKKCLGYFEIEHTNNLYFVTMPVNPKQYYKSFENK